MKRYYKIEKKGFMKKIFVFILLTLSIVSASAQVTFEKNGLRYATTSNTTARVMAPYNDIIGVLEIPSMVTYEMGGIEYVFTVNEIGRFAYCSINEVYLPSTITIIDAQAFAYCSNLKTIKINTSTPPSIHSLAFENTTSQRKLTVPCGSLDAYKSNPSWSSAFSTSNSQGITSDCETYTSVSSGNFNNPATWGLVSMPSTPANYIIKAGDIVNLTSNLILTSENTLRNNGILEIHQSGQLINTTSVNVGGIVEVKTPTKQANEWTFVGAPFSGYSLQAIVPKNNDVSVSMFDYSTGDWSEEWATVETSVVKGEGYFLWPFVEGDIIYTTYGDGKYSHNAGSEYSAFSYSQSASVSYQLNNEDLTITKPVKEYSVGGGNWIALANPYPAKLSVSKFLAGNNGKGIQGGCTYHFNGTTWDIQNAVSGDVLMTDGFLVNFETAGNKTINFSKTQLRDYPSVSAKNIQKLEYIELSLIDGDEKVKLYFSHNEKAKKEYDIFDANKLFSTSDIAEPYFVVNGTSLVKEEVDVLPYTANINVHSTQSKEMSFVVDNLPEGYTVFLIDNGQDIRLSEGLVYTTEFEAGENADRFQLLVKKNRQMDIEEDFDLKVVNENRNVEVISNENVVKVEVVNALGRNVFNTKQKQFTLSDVSSGMYFVKVYISKDSKRIYSKTKKIFIE